MTRAMSGVSIRLKRKKILKAAKGSRGRAKNCYTVAVQRVHKDWQNAYRDRRNRKRDFRALWIQRINAAVREHGLVYARFMHGLKLAQITIDRKVLANMAIYEPVAFEALVQQAKGQLAAS